MRKISDAQRKKNNARNCELYSERKHLPAFRKKRKAAREKLKPWARAYHKRYRNSPRGMAYRLLGDARGRAIRDGIKFNLTVEGYFVPDRCPVFGVKLVRGKGVPHRFSPTLDRINPRKGYTKGNVAVISQYANALKHNGTAKQHRRIAEWIEQQES